LRDAPLWERVLRIAGAVLVTLYLALYAYDGLREPRVVDSGNYGRGAYGQLLGDAAEGRVARVDDRRDDVLWQNRDGAVYEANYGRGIDFRAAVERQEYVRSHPGSVTYGRIHRRDHDGLRDNLVIFFGMVFLLGTVARNASPRRATRWAWFWIVASVAGIPAYLLLSGSWVRPAAPGREDGGWIVGGVAAFVALVVALPVVHDSSDRLYERQHPIRPYGRIVLPAELEPFAPRA
jgi:hypothetical protein